MNSLNAAKLKNFAANVRTRLILAALAVCSIRYMRALLAAASLSIAGIAIPLFKPAPAHKRAVNRNAHLRKFALFKRSGATCQL